VAATNRVIDSMGGPVVLVGHSYGGIIITAAGNNQHVKSMVSKPIYVTPSRSRCRHRAGSAIAPNRGGRFLTSARDPVVLCSGSCLGHFGDHFLGNLARHRVVV
jgi:hypothetical protein